MSARNPVTIEVLEMLDAIDRRGSFAKAAQELNKATSALSYAIQKLEEHLDIALFQRQGRRSVLTPAGQLVLEQGRFILQASTQLARKAREVATGWETQIRIGLESIAPSRQFFTVLTTFLEEFPSIEIDIRECVLNGGWEALEQDRVDLLVGAPEPVPQQKGFRAVLLGANDMLPVISARHAHAGIATDKEAVQRALPKLRRVVIHDTSLIDISRSEGLSKDGRMLYVQNIGQKLHAILCGAGIGNLPKHRIQTYLDSKELVELNVGTDARHRNFLAWKISNKGKGLRALTQMLSAEIKEQGR